MKRRRFLVVLLLCALPAFLFAQETITVFATEHPDVMAPIRDKLNEFEKMSGIKVNLETVPEGQATPKLSLILSSDTGSYDVLYIASVGAVGAMANGNLTPIDPYLPAGFDKSDFPAGLLNLLTYKDQLYGLPIRAETNIMMYRKDIFEKYGVAVPKTLGDFEAAAKRLTMDSSGSGKIDFYGTAPRGAYGQSAYTWNYFFRALGGKYFDTQMNPLLTSPQAVAALELYKRLATDYAPPGGSTYTWQDSFASMQLGKTAMIIESSIQAGSLEDPEKSRFVGKFGYAVPPTGPAGSTPDLKCYGYFIDSKSKNKKAAAQFIAWATGKDLQTYAFEKYKFAALTRNSVLDFAYTKAPFFAAIKESMNKGNIYFLPPIPEQGTVYMATSEAITNVLAGTDSVKNALEKANAKIKQIISDGGYYSGKTPIPQFIKDGNG
jgi:multiple sugar transport system substrate-binding protein